MRLQFVSMLTVLLLLATPSLAETISVRINPLTKEEAPTWLATEYLKKLLEERSADRIQVTIAKGKETGRHEALESLKSGPYQLILTDVRSLKASLPGLRPYDLPFLFRDRLHLHRVLDSEPGRQVLQRSQANNLKPLTIWDGQAQQLLADEALATPGDIPQHLLSPAAADHQWLESPLADAERLADLHTFKTLTLSNHRFSCSVLLTRTDFWNGLPEDVKVIFTGAIKDATTYLRELSEEFDRKALENLKNEKHLEIYPLSDSQKKQWESVTQSLYGQSLDRENLDFIGIITGQTTK